MQQTKYGWSLLSKMSLAVKSNPDLTVKEALSQFYDHQKLDTSVIKNRINFYPLGKIKVPFLNIEARKKIIFYHDLNHIYTGYLTDLVGEGELAAWELASGFPKGFRFGYLYSAFALIPGLVLSPIKMRAAYKKGRHKKNSYMLDMKKSEVAQSKLTEIILLLSSNLKA